MTREEIQKYFRELFCDSDWVCVNCIWADKCKEYKSNCKDKDGRLCEFLGSEKEPLYQFNLFDRVLVRDDDEDIWEANLFAGMASDVGQVLYCVMSGKPYEQCIPYEGNENLAGTTNKPTKQ